MKPSKKSASKINSKSLVKSVKKKKSKDQQIESCSKKGLICRNKSINTGIVLGRYMRYIRKKRGISLNDLGKKIGFDRQTIARFELEGGASFELVLSLMHYFKLDEILDEIKKPLRKNKKLMEKFPV